MKMVTKVAKWLKFVTIKTDKMFRFMNILCPFELISIKMHLLPILHHIKKTYHNSCLYFAGLLREFSGQVCDCIKSLKMK